MSRAVPIILNRRAWIPSHAVPKRMKDEFFYTRKEQKYDVEGGFWDEIEVGIDLTVSNASNTLVGFPRGDLHKVLKYFSNYGLIDRRAVAPLGFPIELNNDVTKDSRWPDQQSLLAAWMKAGSGVVNAPAASGKSVIGVAAVCSLGLRTLCLFDRKDFLFQWHNEFYNHTNLEFIESESGIQLAGQFVGKEVWPLTFSTFQRLNTKKSRKFMKRYSDYFGLIIIDEVHHLSAPTHRRAVLQFNPLAHMGVTATPDRKDTLERIYFDVIGPVTAKGGLQQMKPKVLIHHTDLEVRMHHNKPDFAQWGVFIKQICKSEKRNKLIINLVKEDLKDGRCIAVITERVAHAFHLRDLLSEYVDSARMVVVVGTTKGREEIYEDINRGKYDVLFAGPVIEEGVNITRLDCAHLVTPLSGKGRRLTQRVGRIRRPLLGKKQPLVHDYIDEGPGMLFGAFMSRLKTYGAIGAQIVDTKTRYNVDPRTGLAKRGRTR